MANVLANPASERLPAFGLYHDAWGQLVLIDAQGQRHEGIVPVRMFPFTDPQHWLSLVNSSGREIVCIEDSNELAPAVREVLEQELFRREFIPVIERIYGVSSILEPSEWDVQTNRGRTKFVLKAEEDVRRLSNQQAIILDSTGVRYLIQNVDQLDAASQDVLQRYV
jgi:Domain of unknown function (DUF1854)